MNTKVASIFEYGCGEFSTKLFHDENKNYISVEQQSVEWFYKMKYYNVKYIPGPTDAIDYYKCMKEQFDMVFVDGHGDSRWLCVQEAMNKKVRYIVAHDTEQPTYQWSRINKATYMEIIIQEKIPWTTVWTLDYNLLSGLSQSFNSTIY